VKAYREVEPVVIGQWNKLLNAIAEIRRSGILEDVVRHLSKDPSYEVRFQPVSDRIVDTYLMKMKTQTEMVVQQIQQENRTSKAGELLRQIFGTESIVRLKNYAERANAPFEKKMLGGYLYVEELNYLKAFLIDYFKRDIRALTDLFLVRGKWTVSSLSSGFSGPSTSSSRYLTGSRRSTSPSPTTRTSARSSTRCSRAPSATRKS
jgi:hypothetical protein